MYKIYSNNVPTLYSTKFFIYLGITFIINLIQKNNGNLNTICIQF